jgi:hypothetical protein
MRQGGNPLVTGGTRSTICLASPHSAPSWQTVRAQRAAIRKTSVGFTVSARRNSARLVACGSVRYPTRGSSEVPPTTPRTTLPSISGRALGHNGERSGSCLIGDLVPGDGSKDASGQQVCHADAVPSQLSRTQIWQRGSVVAGSCRQVTVGTHSPPFPPPPSLQSTQRSRMLHHGVSLPVRQNLDAFAHSPGGGQPNRAGRSSRPRSAVKAGTLIGGTSSSVVSYWQNMSTLQSRVTSHCGIRQNGNGTTRHSSGRTRQSRLVVHLELHDWPGPQLQMMPSSGAKHRAPLPHVGSGPPPPMPPPPPPPPGTSAHSSRHSRTHSRPSPPADLQASMQSLMHCWCGSCATISQTWPSRCRTATRR